MTNKDIILYSLSVGFNEDPLNKEHFRFTYENDENFSAFPTMPVVIAHKNLGEVTTTPGLPAFNPMMLLHGEENLEIFKPILPGMKLTVEEQLLDL